MPVYYSGSPSHVCSTPPSFSSMHHSIGCLGRQKDYLRPFSRPPDDTRHHGSRITFHSGLSNSKTLTATVFHFPSLLRGYPLLMHLPRIQIRPHLHLASPFHWSTSSHTATNLCRASHSIHGWRLCMSRGRIQCPGSSSFFLSSSRSLASCSRIVLCCLHFLFNHRLRLHRYDLSFSKPNNYPDIDSLPPLIPLPSGSSLCTTPPTTDVFAHHALVRAVVVHRMHEIGLGGRVSAAVCRRLHISITRASSRWMVRRGRRIYFA